MTIPADMLPTLAFDILVRLRERAPRVQCLTNSVAQQITANVLLAAGARVSMATHPDEVVDMTASADALLINLGTIDAARIAAIPRLLTDARVLAKPRVLDPVFVEHSPLRLTLAQQIIAAGPLIVKGNASELAALELPPHVTRVETGPSDTISNGTQRITILSGDSTMGKVTGLGCAVGGLIAACSAVEPDPLLASAAGLLAFVAAGERAAKKSQGPGSFAVSLIDCIAALEERHLWSMLYGVDPIG